MGIFVGVLISWKVRSKRYSGTIVVRTDENTNKTVYSLELAEGFESLETKSVVVFNVDRE